MVIFCSGCASSFSTIKTNNPFLKTRYYNASYDKVINAVVEAASKTRNCSVEDVDEPQGLITIIDSDIWRNYIIKVKVKQIEVNRARVDIVSYTQADIVAANRKFVAEILERLDNLLN